MKIFPGDLLKAKTGIICHQVNCLGKFGAGLAKQIARRWPKVKSLYLHKFKKDGWKLGDVQLINVGDPGQDLYVANCASQYGVSTGRPQTDYPSIKQCFEHIVLLRLSLGKNLPIYVPYGYGCGLGGGDWNTVMTIIETVIPDTIAIALREDSADAFRLVKRPLRGPQAGEGSSSLHPRADQAPT